MKVYNRREIEKILLKNGWKVDRYTGGHVIYKKEGIDRTISISYRKCNRMMFQRLVKEFDLIT